MLTKKERAPQERRLLRSLLKQKLRVGWNQLKQLLFIFRPLIIIPLSVLATRKVMFWHGLLPGPWGLKERKNQRRMRRLAWQNHWLIRRAKSVFPKLLFW